MRACHSCRWCLAACFVLCHVLSVLSMKLSPCSEILPIKKTEPFEVGLVFWPGGLESDWGSPETGLQPCNAEVQANLTAQGAMFATYHARADRLTVLKTSFPEELILTGRAPSTAAKIISVVAFRNSVRSDVKYIASFDPDITFGTGFVTSLALLAKFELGTLKYLQFYNLTCNDCGGRTSERCINSTSCALDYSVCTCSRTTSGSNSTSSSSSSPSPSPLPAADQSPAPSTRHLLQDASPSPAPESSPTPQLGVNESTSGASVCNYANFSFCATGINLAFEGVDANSAAFTTAAQVKKLSSYSLVSLYFKAKAAFFDVKDLFTAKAGEYWGNFGAVQDDIQAAYSGNAQAYTDSVGAGFAG